MFTGEILLFTMIGGLERVFKVVAEQMVMEMVDDKEQEMVNNVALFRTF